MFVLFVIGVSLAVPAVAAPGSGSPAQRYVACVAQNKPAEVRALLAAADLAAAKAPYRSLSGNERCMAMVFKDQSYRPEDASFPMDVLRGRLAEQALLASLNQAVALPALPLEQKRYVRPWFAATGRNAAVDEMAACIADIDPAGVLALVRTAHESAVESQAVSALSPALGKCLSAGTRLQASRPALRAALAEALYQRLNNPALSAPAEERPK